MAETNLDAIAAMKHVTKPLGIEVATKPDMSRTVDFVPIGEWLGHIEQSRLSQTPVSDVARIDSSLGYMQELKGKSQEAGSHNTSITVGDVEKFSQQYKSTVEDGIRKSNDLVGDLTAVPNAGEANQLAATITKARVLGEVQRVMQTPDVNGRHPTFDEAVARIESQMGISRQKVVENAINDATRIIRSPDSFYQGEASTWEEWLTETTAFENQARTNLGQLELLRFSNYYTQVGNRVERTGAITKAIENLANAGNQQVYGRQERMQAVIDYSESHGLLDNDQIASVLKNYPHIRTEERSAVTEAAADVTALTVVHAEDGRLVENEPEICQKEDVEKLEQKIVDKEHVNWHGRSIFIPDTHGANQQAIESSIRQAYGTDVAVDFRDGKVFADGEEVILYQGGDIIDFNKDLIRWYSMDAGGLASQAEYDTALSDEKHPKHDKAVRRKEYFDRTPGAYEEFQEKWQRLNNMRVNESVDYWKDALKEGRVLWGNHEAMMMAGFVGDNDALLTWLTDTNQGSSTLQALTGLSRESDLGLGGVDENIINNMDPQKKSEVCNRVREAMRSSPQSKELITSLLDNAKLYNIVNGELIIHACVPVNKNTGKLIPPESSRSRRDSYLQVPKREQYPTEEAFQAATASQKKAQEFYDKADTLTGLEALDYIEQQIRERNPYAILFIANGRAETMSPVWGRKPFQEAMQSHGDVVISELSQQAEKKGILGGIKKIIVGNTPTIGGSQVGEKLLGADDDRHSAVRLELTKDASGRINTEARAVHNFGSSSLITDTVL